MKTCFHLLQQVTQTSTRYAKIDKLNIVFYSTNSNNYNGEETEIKTLPLRSHCLDSLVSDFPQHKFFVVTQLPGSFVLDLDKNQISPKSSSVEYKISEKKSAVDFASDILELKPDLAVVATFWVSPYDWMGLKDCLVADELKKNGVDVVCTNDESQMICFDKKLTADFLKANNFYCAKSIYVHHENFWAERGKKELVTNNYKDFVLSKVAAMKYPVVIKDCVGLSSAGMEVATTFPQAVHYLKNGRNTSDRLVEEYIDGLHFGTEIYGRNGEYKIMPPLIFSLNRFGITSPKLSVKMGPVESANFKIDELKSMLFDLAKKLDINGVAQVDLIFSDGKWFIVEINPRLSGMTETYCAAMGISVFDLMTHIALDQAKNLPEPKPVCNFKLPLLDDDQMKRITSLPQVKYFHQHKNLAAKQEREKGYCEIAVSSSKDFNQLVDFIGQIKQIYPSLFEGPAWEHLLWAKDIMEDKR